MKFKKIIVLLLVLPLFAFTMHKYYVSLCEIEFIKEKQSIQITLGVFIEDLEVTLNKNSGKQLNLASKTEVVNIDDYYKKYLTTIKNTSMNIYKSL